MLRILITGATGGIGMALSKALTTEGHEVVAVRDADLRIEDPAYFDQFDKPEKIDVVYHLAAATFVPKSWETPADFIKVNVLGTTHVLEFCRMYHIQLVFASSYAYGIPEYLPIDESHPVSAANPYGLSKIMAEELCEFYGQNFDLSYVIVRPFNVFGTLKNKTLLIPEIIEQIQDGESVHVRDLTPKRDYIYIDDLINFFVAVGGRTNNQIYNIGTGQSYSVEEIIGICQNVWETHLPVYSDNEGRKNEIPDTCCDISKAKKDFNWTPKYSFEEGIRALKERMENY